MKPSLLFAALFLGAASPLRAQSDIPAPAGWRVHSKAGGARTFTPPDLRAGERYSVTVYPPVALNGRTLDEFLRAFAGPVGTKTGALNAPLQTQRASGGSVLIGAGAYNATGGAPLYVAFFGASPDGTNIVVERVLFSSDSLFSRRYMAQNTAIFRALMRSGARAVPLSAGGKNTAQQGTEVAREIEAARFKWVTKPGRGVPNARIEAVWLEGIVNALAGRVDTTVYLLLRDGTVYADLPVPPDELDIARSKAHEPSKWGRWRKTAAGYSVSLHGARFEELGGQQVFPAPANTRLAGRYSGGSGSSMGGFSSYALSDVTFTRDGRFRRGGSGGTSVSSGFGDNASNASTTYDNEGSASIATGPGYVAGSSRKRRSASDHQGTYSLSGYTLTLRTDSGRVERLPFFFDGSTRSHGRDALWFDGQTLTLDDSK